MIKRRCDSVCKFVIGVYWRVNAFCALSIPLWKYPFLYHLLWVGLEGFELDRYLFACVKLWFGRIDAGLSLTVCEKKMFVVIECFRVLTWSWRREVIVCFGRFWRRCIITLTVFWNKKKMLFVVVECFRVLTWSLRREVLFVVVDWRVVSARFQFLVDLVVVTRSSFLLWLIEE
jgi:hypothetical protein